MSEAMVLLAQPPAADIIFQIIIQNYYTRERVSERERGMTNTRTKERQTHRPKIANILSKEREECTFGNVLNNRPATC